MTRLDFPRHRRVLAASRAASFACVAAACASRPRAPAVEPPEPVEIRARPPLTAAATLRPPPPFALDMLLPLRATVVFTGAVTPPSRGPCDPCVPSPQADALYVVNGVVWGRPNQAGSGGDAARRRLAGLDPRAVTGVEVIRDPATLRTYGVRRGVIVRITTTER